MGPAKSTAQSLLDKADKKANSSTGWFSSSSTKFEEAGDLYQQAANSFKLEKLFKEAGDAFSREAECREKCKEVHEAANAWWNAAKAYKRADPACSDLAIEALNQAVTHLTMSGRFRQAADKKKEIAQIYLQKVDPDWRKAHNAYVQAGDWYSQEDATATASACYKDAADLAAELGDYLQAIERYEQVANAALLSNLTKYSVKEYWFRSCLCALALKDTVLARSKLKVYEGKDPGFPVTREAKFLEALIDAAHAGDVEAFTSVVYDFDQVVKLDNWTTDILLKIKRWIADPGLT